MTTQIQRRRGTTAQHSTFTGAEAELTVDTTKDTVVVHDGSTVGGRPLLREDQSNLPTTAPTTGIYNASGALAISTGGSGRLFVSNSGVYTNQNYFTDATSGYFFGGSASFSNGIYGIGTNNCAIAVNGTERLRITAAGLVGVGTSSPSDYLHISSSGGNTAAVRLQASDGRSYIVGSTGSGYGSANNFIIYDATASAERLRITSAGNVGIGTTSPSALLHLNATAPALLIARSSAAGTPSATGLQLSIDGTTYGRIYATSSGGIGFSGPTSDYATLDSSGRLLVGTSSVSGSTGTAPYARVQVQGNAFSSTTQGAIAIKHGSAPASIGANATVGSIAFAANNDGEYAWIDCVADGAGGTNDYPGRLVFSTTADGASSPTERMRINSAGQVTCVQNAANTASLVLDTISSSYTTTQFLLNNYTAATTGFNFITCHSGNFAATNFRVQGNGNVQNTNNSYGAISDIKLKENIIDATSQWSDIKALQVRKYNFKEGQTHTQIGLVAQEVELVSPGLVSESPDRDEEGNDLGTVTKSVNYSVLYMKAVKALQEAMERIEVLEQRLTDAGIA